MSNINITFLGTASAQPSRTRNHSSLALRISTNVWLFDCGEATQRQIQQSSVKMGRIIKIFITHTHGDHIFGLVPLMACRLDGAGGSADPEADPRLHQSLSTLPPLEIYGPSGTREYVRSALKYSYSHLGSSYIVHELHHPGNIFDASDLSQHLDNAELSGGRDLSLDEDGTWKDIFTDDIVTVSAAPIHHSVPCVGYVITEKPLPGRIDPQSYIPALKRNKAPMNLLGTLQKGHDITLEDGTVLHPPPKRPGRKIAILGDTFDPSPIASLATGVDILVHEATNAHLPHIDRYRTKDDTFETVEARAKSRGHSTPQMAGAFARTIGAQKLILNHFSSRYPGDDDVNAESRETMESIRDLASKEFPGQEVICARDMMSLDIPLGTANP